MGPRCIPDRVGDRLARLHGPKRTALSSIGFRERRDPTGGFVDRRPGRAWRARGARDRACARTAVPPRLRGLPGRRSTSPTGRSRSAGSVTRRRGPGRRGARVGRGGRARGDAGCRRGGVGPDRSSYRSMHPPPATDALPETLDGSRRNRSPCVSMPGTSPFVWTTVPIRYRTAPRRRRPGGCRPGISSSPGRPRRCGSTGRRTTRCTPSRIDATRTTSSVCGSSRVNPMKTSSAGCRDRCSSQDR